MKPVHPAKHVYHFAKPHADADAAADVSEVTVTQITAVTQEDGKTRMVRFVRVVITRANIARPICSALMGEHHRPVHRMLTGASIMIVGVVVAKTLGHLPNELIAGVGELLGYAIHGLGLTPFVDHLAAKFRK